jgi:hypothetical protein
MTALARDLYGGNNRELGAAIAGYFSAVLHGTAYGLTQSVSLDFPEAPVTPGVTWGAIFTSSGSTCSVLAAIFLALDKAWRARNELFGWGDAEWKSARTEVARAAKAALGSSNSLANSL